MGVQFLVQRGFDWNVGDNKGKTGFQVACRYGNLNVIRFLLQQEFEGINDLDLNGKAGLECLIDGRHNYADKRLMPCILLLIEAGAELDENEVFEKLIPAIQNRIIEITFMKETILEKWTGRIAQASI